MPGIGTSPIIRFGITRPIRETSARHLEITRQITQVRQRLKNLISPSRIHLAIGKPKGRVNGIGPLVFIEFLLPKFLVRRFPPLLGVEYLALKAKVRIKHAPGELLGSLSLTRLELTALSDFPAALELAHFLEIKAP